MYYANGKEARVGDQVVGKGPCGNPLAGTVISINAQSDSYNLQIILPQTPSYSATAAECLLIDDITELNKKANTREE